MMTDKIRAALATSAERLRELGFCPECNTAPSMDEEGPFSSCLCGTGEDYGKRPLQRLQLLERQASRATPAPIDMILHCPECHVQHIDEPETHEEFHGDGGPVEVATWTNPPHRSHLCHNCGTIWRPADVPTNGVAAIKTVGKADRRATPALPQGSSYGFLHMLDSTEGLSENRPEIMHSFSSTNPFGRAGIDYDASFAHHVITLDRALHRQALPQGVEEAVIEKALRLAFNLGQTYWQQADSESYSQNRKSVDTLQKFNALVVETSSKLSGMAIVPVECLAITEFALRRLQFDTPKNGRDYEAITNALNAMLAAAKEKGE